MQKEFTCRQKNKNVFFRLCGKFLAIALLALVSFQTSQAQVTIFSEDFSSGSFGTNNWTRPNDFSNNWFIDYGSYNPPGDALPGASFNWDPEVTNYSIPLVSESIDCSIYSGITLSYDLSLNNYETSTVETFDVQYEIAGSNNWVELDHFDNQSDFNFNVNQIMTNAVNEALSGMDGQMIQIQFVAGGDRKSVV